MMAKLARETFYTAVDIGTTKICSLVARVGTEGELKVLGFGNVPAQGVLKGRIENLSEAQEAVGLSLEEAQRYISRGSISGAYVGVSGSHLTCLNIKDAMTDSQDMGGITGHQLRHLLQASYPQVDPSQQVLHIIPIGYEVDGLPGVRNPTGLHAKQVTVEAHVVLGDAAILKNSVRAVEFNKIPVKSLVAHSLASAEATLTGDEREMGVMLADIGGGTTDVALYRQGSPWFSAVIPVGGNQLTRDLAAALHVPYYRAEELKVKWGNALTDLIRADEEVVVPGFQGEPQRVIKRRAMCEPLQMRLAELLKLAILRVNQAGLRHMPSSGLVLTGGCAEMPGIRELAQKITGGPVRVASPLGIAGLPAELRKPAFSASVGILLWGIKHQSDGQPYRSEQRSFWGGFLAGRFLRSKEKVTEELPVGGRP
jgi:cell division protein FtsA